MATGKTCPACGHIHASADTYAVGPCLPVIALSAVPHLETAPLPDASDVRPSPPARDAVTLGYDEASRVPEGQHVAREVFTADGIPFVRCSCSTAKSPTSHRWLSEHVPNGGVAELQAVVKRQAEGAKA